VCAVDPLEGAGPFDAFEAAGADDQRQFIGPDPVAAPARLFGPAADIGGLSGRLGGGDAGITEQYAQPDRDTQDAFPRHRHLRTLRCSNDVTEDREPRPEAVS
jgi:hypothetical protein